MFPWSCMCTHCKLELPPRYNTYAPHGPELLKTKSMAKSKRASSCIGWTKPGTHNLNGIIMYNVSLTNYSYMSGIVCSGLQCCTCLERKQMNRWRLIMRQLFVASIFG